MSTPLRTACFLLLLMFTGAGWSANVMVTASNFSFTPSSVTINAGDTVTFVNGGGFHNAHSTSGPTSFECADDCSGNGAPSGDGWSDTVMFPTAGTVNYQCDEHASMGMTGQIIVKAVTPPPPSIALGGYLSGNWYNPEQSGHGFQLEFTNVNNNMVAIWFVYTPDGTGQNWIYAQGPYDPTSNTVTLNAILLTGAKFPPLFVSSDLTNTPWGTLTFTFSDCNNGTASWAPTLASYPPSSAPLAITRLTQIAGTTCPQ